MRISASDNYYHPVICRLETCERHYCAEHRRFWRDCDTAVKTRDGAGQQWYELGDAPCCEEKVRAKRVA